MGKTRGGARSIHLGVGLGAKYRKHRGYRAKSQVYKKNAGEGLEVRGGGQFSMCHSWHKNSMVLLTDCECLRGTGCRIW